MTVSGFSTMETASTAAASGRQRKLMSEEFIACFRAAKSFRTLSSRIISSMSLLSLSRSYILSPVVPALPSMNIFFIFILTNV